jgi:hypothetical protein
LTNDVGELTKTGYALRLACACGAAFERCVTFEKMPPALLALRCWLDSWVGIGLIERGIARDGYDLSLTAMQTMAGEPPSTSPEGTLSYSRNRLGVGADAVAGDAGCRMGGAYDGRCGGLKFVDVS